MVRRNETVTEVPVPVTAGVPAEPVHVQLVGELLHTANRVTVRADPDGIVSGFAVTEHTGTAVGGSTLMDAVAGALVPAPLVAVTE